MVEEKGGYIMPFMSTSNKDQVKMAIICDALFFIGAVVYALHFAHVNQCWSAMIMHFGVIVIAVAMAGVGAQIFERSKPDSPQWQTVVPAILLLLSFGLGASNAVIAMKTKGDILLMVLMCIYVCTLVAVLCFVENLEEKRPRVSNEERPITE